MSQKKADALQIPKHIYDEDEDSKGYLHQVHQRNFYEFPDVVQGIYLQIMAMAPEVALSEELGLSLMAIKEVWETWYQIITAREDMHHKELQVLEYTMEDYFTDLHRLRQEVAEQVRVERRDRYEQTMKEVS